jgi:hypothetical protein
LRVLAIVLGLVAVVPVFAIGRPIVATARTIVVRHGDGAEQRRQDCSG